MKPLVLDDPLAAALYFGCLGAWTIAEVVLAIRTTGSGTESDRSHIPLFLAGGAGFGLAIYVAANATSLSISGGDAWPLVVGLSLALAGAAFRYWAIHTLGRFFVFVVAIQEDHRVIDTGPYAIVRHPGYLGLLATMLGFALALDNWAALAISFLPPFIGFTRRIVLEERVLREELGESYRDYARRTYRLLPGLWTLAVVCFALALAAPSAPAQKLATYEDPLGPGWVIQALGLQYDLAADVPLRNAPWVSTHNSFNSIAEMGPTLSTLDSNQQIPLSSQLDQGVRNLELDLHWFPSLRAGGFAPVVCHALEGGGGCTAEKPLDVVLGEIASWLGARGNSDQLLLLYLEDDLSSGQDGYDASAAALNAAFGKRIYRPPAGGACAKLPLGLTRERILRSGARVLIVSNCGQGSAWNGTVFDWSNHEEERPFDYTDYPDCGGDFTRRTYDRSLIRYFEDSTYLTQGTGETDDGISGRSASWMARCGVDLIGLDQLGYPDSRLAALVWSWAPGEPRGGGCAVQFLHEILYPFGRWEARRCDLDRRPACVKASGRWVVAAGSGPVSAAGARCRAAGARFAVPRTGFEAQLLRKAMERANVTEVWLGYRRVRGKWTALDVR